MLYKPNRQQVLQEQENKTANDSSQEDYAHLLPKVTPCFFLRGLHLSVKFSVL
jgi:hypothetical protein